MHQSKIACLAVALSLALAAVACSSSSTSTAAPSDAATPPAPSPEQPTPAPAGSDQPAPAPAASDAAAPSEGRAAGGYTTRDPNDEKIKAAADKAVELLREKQKDPSITLVSIVTAETQVVAGTNFKLQLSLKTAQGAKTVTVVVYRDLKSQHTLTSVDGL